jgi:hypothetical protein
MEHDTLKPLTAPWRFRAGQIVYVHSHDQDRSYLIVDGFLHKGMPHYKILGYQEIWTVPQCHLSTKPLTAMTWFL